MFKIYICFSIINTKFYYFIINKIKTKIEIKQFIYNIYIQIYNLL